MTPNGVGISLITRCERGQNGNTGIAGYHPPGDLAAGATGASRFFAFWSFGPQIEHETGKLVQGGPCDHAVHMQKKRPSKEGPSAASPPEYAP